jgi:UDP-4-amino-4,6-dideoxy-N-acetyl-beta-L-altrosamine N-acetyltransferase
MSDTGGAVSLRPLQLGDITRVLEWRNLPEVATYMYTDHRISDAEHARWFASAMTDETKRYWIIELDREPVGLANLYDISTLQRRAYWAFYLADDRVRGRGVGSATERFVMRHVFEELALDKLCCEVLATNEGVVKMHERYGFQVDGVLRRHVIKAGVRIDVITMSLLRDEWAASRWASGEATVVVRAVDGVSSRGVDAKTR